MTDLVHHVLTDRLLEHLDPFSVLGLLPEYPCEDTRPLWPSLEEVRDAPLSEFIPVMKRSVSIPWHLGRIRYFVEILEKGGSVEPLEVDNLCDGGHIYPQAILLDGHHRLAAAALLGLPRVTISYGGLLDLLDWLTGDRENEPKEGT